MNLRIRFPLLDVAGAMNVTSGTSAGQASIAWPTPDHMAPNILKALPLAVDGSEADWPPAALVGRTPQRAASFRLDAIVFCRNAAEHPRRRPACYPSKPQCESATRPGDGSA